MAGFKEMFHDHPASVGESYGEHMGFAFGFGWRLLKAALAAFVHGLVPVLCKTTASSAVLGMNDEIRARRAEANRAPRGPLVTRDRGAAGS